jgi:hypothetical protein
MVALSLGGLRLSLGVLVPLFLSVAVTFAVHAHGLVHDQA